jgi:D-alanine-D-alanine ligase
MGERPRVAVVFGGRSGEHEVSVRSAASVASGLLARHDVCCVLVDKEGRWLLQDGDKPQPEGGEPVFLAPMPAEGGRLRRLADASLLASPDVYFPVLHGPYGEDGTVQGLFELAAVPYVGAGVAASAAAMDKEMMKALFARAGLPQVDYRVIRAAERAASASLVGELGLPLFVKPANLGSSVAVSKVRAVSVLGNERPEASVPGEIVPDREFYDYDSKYAPDSRTELKIPAPVPDALAAEARRFAALAFRAIGAAGYARVDLFLKRAEKTLLVNEINTIPGFTSISMFPKLWEASGLPYPDLLARLVALARERHEARARLRTDLRR